MPIPVVRSREDRFDARQLHWFGSGSAIAVESTEFPGSRLATAEQPRRLAELIEELRQTTHVAQAKRR